MPTYVLALYGAPDDPAAFDDYYEAKHAPLARKIPGLRSFGMSNGRAFAPDGAVAHHRVALLEFDSLDDARCAFASPEGHATAADLANFATGGVSLAMFDLKDLGVAEPAHRDDAAATADGGAG
jgi:uncharacterized protein (TIGR02118 family)